ncbi:MAG: prohibitin family protein [Candidatus Altiarchaeota archaeon]
MVRYSMDGVEAVDGSRIGKWVLTAVAGFFIAILLLSSIFDVLVVVQPGYVGVDYNAWGGINMDRVREPGWSFKLPIVTKVYMVKTARDTVNLYPGGDDVPVTAPTKEGLLVTTDVSVLYRIKPGVAPKLVQELTPDYRRGTIMPRIRSIVRDVSGGMSVTEIYGPGRGRLQTEIFDRLKGELEKDGFILEEVLVREIDMPTDITSAIEDKQTMEQTAMKKQYEVDLTLKEAERLKLQGLGTANQQVAVAEGDAKANIARAKGEVEAKVMLAKAEAEALKTVADAMRENPKALDYKQLQVLEALYKNPNTKFVALPSNQMIYQLPQDAGQ